MPTSVCAALFVFILLQGTAFAWNKNVFRSGGGNAYHMAMTALAPAPLCRIDDEQALRFLAEEMAVALGLEGSFAAAAATYVNASGIPVYFRLHSALPGKALIDVVYVYWITGSDWKDIGAWAAMEAYGGEDYYIPRALQPDTAEITVLCLVEINDGPDGVVPDFAVHLENMMREDYAELIQATNNAAFFHPGWKDFAEMGGLIPYIND